MEAHGHEAQGTPPPLHAFIVDDDRDLLAPICEVLAECGIDATPLANAEDAMANLECGVRPDFVLLDFRLPQLSGDAMLRSLKGDERWRDIPVAAMTAYPPELFPAFALADAFLPKPFDVEALEELVTMLSRWARPDGKGETPAPWLDVAAGTAAGAASEGRS